MFLNKREFHPIVEFVFFTSVVVLTFLSFNPIKLFISFTGACICLYGVKGSVKGLIKGIPIFIVISVINPLFSHRGATTLFYLPDGNPFTAESVCFGICAGGMLFSVLLWSVSLSEIITSEKVIYLCGKFLPNGSLVMSMTFSFVPRLIRAMKEIFSLQKIYCKGRFKAMLSSVLILLTWAFEGSLLSSDSMRARGFDTGKRTAYTLFRFMKRDALALLVISCITALLVFCIASGMEKTVFYPFFGMENDPVFYLLFTLLCIMPIFLFRRGKNGTVQN